MVFDAARPRRLALPLLTSLVSKGCRLLCSRDVGTVFAAALHHSRGGSVIHFDVAICHIERDSGVITLIRCVRKQNVCGSGVFPGGEP